MADQRRQEAVIDQLEARIAKEERHTRCVNCRAGRRLESRLEGLATEAGEGLVEALRREGEGLARVEKAVEGLKEGMGRLIDMLRDWEEV
jgi:hypothetical protein